MEPLLEAAPAPGTQRTLLAALDRAVDVRDAARAVVDHLAEQGLMPSFYLEQGDRLRCQAVRGYWQIFDGMGPDTGVIGHTFRSGEASVELDVRESANYMEAVGGVVAEVCVPVRVGGRTVGVLNAESTVALGPGALPEVTRCAAALAACLERLGPLDVPSPAQSLARIAARLAALSEPAAIVAETAQAARELSGFASALIVVTEAGAEAEPDAAARRFAIGPLGPTLAGLSPQSIDRMAGWIAGGTSSYTIGESGGRGFVGHEPLRRAGAAAMLVLPLAAAGDRLGLLVLADQAAIRLDPDVVELLELLAMQAASVLGTALAVRELRRRAENDALTGLGHHATFHADLVTRRREATTPLAIILVDVDDFKSINDDLGHASGDAVLRDVAELLRRPRGARGYRIGGDEFALLLPVQDGAAARELGEWICGRVREGLEDVTVSVGVALPEPDESDAAVFARADAALYAAKAAGRDRAVMA